MEKAVRSYSYRGPVGATSPAGQALSEALDLAMEGRSPYPDKATFIDADKPETNREVKGAAREGQHAVIVSPSGRTRVMSPDEVLTENHDAA